MSDITYIKNWEWTEAVYGDLNQYTFWTTMDPSETCWIVKFRGSFYSYREWVFNRLAYRLGLNAVNVRLANVSKLDLIKTKQDTDTEPFQLLTKNIYVHDSLLCKPDCPFPEFNKNIQENRDFCKFALTTSYNYIDYILKDFMCDIFGGHEPSEYLFGIDHKLYIIDNEQMFQRSGPAGRISSKWLTGENNTNSKQGIKLLQELCHKIISISDHELMQISKYPESYKVDMLWDILPILHKGRELAQSILTKGPVIY